MLKSRILACSVRAGTAKGEEQLEELEEGFNQQRHNLELEAAVKYGATRKKVEGMLKLGNLDAETARRVALGGSEPGFLAAERSVLFAQLVPLKGGKGKKKVVAAFRFTPDAVKDQKSEDALAKLAASSAELAKKVRPNCSLLAGFNGFVVPWSACCFRSFLVPDLLFFFLYVYPAHAPHSPSFAPLSFSGSVRARQELEATTVERSQDGKSAKAATMIQTLARMKKARAAIAVQRKKVEEEMGSDWSDSSDDRGRRGKGKSRGKGGKSRGGGRGRGRGGGSDDGSSTDEDEERCV